MTWDSTLLNYFINAGLVVKLVMLLLIGASIFSWMYIFQRAAYIRSIRKATNKFEELFWSGGDLGEFYVQCTKQKAHLRGVESIFHAGFREFLRFRKTNNPNLPAEPIIENVQRAMRVEQMKEQDKLETSLPFLAIVGTTSPYVGLFGTVWGIMQSFRALAQVQQATIAMVAPGIAEALIATALGLFTVIPAVVAYNRYASDINRLLNRFDAFQEGFINILFRQLQDKSMVKESAENGLS